MSSVFRTIKAKLTRKKKERTGAPQLTIQPHPAVRDVPSPPPGAA